MRRVPSATLSLSDAATVGLSQATRRIARRSQAETERSSARAARSISALSTGSTCKINCSVNRRLISYAAFDGVQALFEGVHPPLHFFAERADHLAHGLFAAKQLRLDDVVTELIHGRVRVAHASPLAC